MEGKEEESNWDQEISPKRRRKEGRSLLEEVEPSFFLFLPLCLINVVVVHY
jgi:hypothetical protein